MQITSPIAVAINTIIKPIFTAWEKNGFGKCISKNELGTTMINPRIKSIVPIFLSV